MKLLNIPPPPPSAIMKISGLKMLKTEIGRARLFGNVNLIGLNDSAELEGSFRGIYPLELKQ